MENNGRGIFYGVIGVATLVVAIIGATFAYFSASAGTKVNVQTGGATVGLTWSEDNGKVLTDLIPMDVIDGAQLEQFITEVKSGDCKDKNKYNVCSVYEYTVGNEGSVAQAVAPTLNIGDFGFDKLPAVDGVTPTDNFHVAIFKGGMDTISADTDFKTVATFTKVEDAAQGALVYTHTFTAEDVDDEGKGSIELTTLNETLAAETGTATYTMVFWIEEAGHAQDYDQGDSFIGSISYLTAGGSQISGNLSA